MVKFKQFSINQSYMTAFYLLKSNTLFNKILLSSSPPELEPATVGIQVNCTMCCVYGSTRIF